MFGVGHWWILLLILVLVLVFWGPQKLPEVGSGIGRAIREFKHATNDVRDSVVNAPSTPAPAQPAPISSTPTPAPGEQHQPVAAVPDDKRPS